MSKKKHSAESLQTWLLAHPLIKVKALEERSKVPVHTIKHSLVLGLRNLPEKYIEQIVAVLKEYGYK
jgi:hypothetical protein